MQIIIEEVYVMKIWWLDYHPAFNSASYVNYDDYANMRKLFKECKSVASNWTALRVSIEDRNKPSDFMYRTGGSLIVSARAKDLILQIPNINVEFLPLISDSELYVLNVLTALDCVDPDQSLEKRIDGSGRLIGYEQFAFRQEVVEGHDIFRVRLHEGDHILDEIYLSDKLKQIIEEQLFGFQLIEIWDSNFSWKQKEEKYSSMCEDVDKSLVETFDFNRAIKYIKSNKGKHAYSGNWSLKVDEKDEILLGDLLLDGTYSWMNPIYYPPIILGLVWGIKEKRKSLVSRLKDGFSFN